MFLSSTHLLPVWNIHAVEKNNIKKPLTIIFIPGGAYNFAANRRFHLPCHRVSEGFFSSLNWRKVMRVRLLA